MPSTSETGHAKNVANFEDLISFCNAYGATYNPSKAAFKIPALQTQFTAAQTAINAVKSSQTAFNNATNSRQDAFKPLKPLATKIINALEATDASVQTIKDAKTINRKIQGKKATKPKTTPSDGSTTPTDKTISSSQQSYDQLIEHFSKLIELLASETNYTPNEADLTVAALQTKLAELKTLNTALVESYTKFSNSLIERNNVLYNALTGLVPTALDIKKYIKSIFGATSAQFKQVNGLEFKVRKD
jgi:hypothetical protein